MHPYQKLTDRDRRIRSFRLLGGCIVVRCRGEARSYKHLGNPRLPDACLPMAARGLIRAQSASFNQGMTTLRNLGLPNQPVRYRYSNHDQTSSPVTGSSTTIIRGHSRFFSSYVRKKTGGRSGVLSVLEYR